MGGEGLSENYASAFAGKLTPGTSPALMLVDMVSAYTEPTSPFYCDSAAAAIASAARLLASAREAQLPVVLTNVEYEAGGGNGGLFYRKVPALKAFDQGSPLGQFPSELKPEATDQIVTKQYPSAFFGTGLGKVLTELGVDTLVIGGFSTSGCVRASALDALQFGFAPFVVRDACADRHPEPHEANLFDLQAKYAEVIDEAAALDILR